ncbi:histidine phosphatase family protein [Synechococcus sp. CBW1107]|uniref:histidine phosphatase family protein n=1 Tax=Synechococcus sp. CBW1107 TaxID=2789857 RepID=UPI002AD4B995|nr:histidine phosphatase family protein [Synechococcus sp. CBW1107]CAK6689825.1 Acid phosphatase [Synechococcus sp. CBW1107]
MSTRSRSDVDVLLIRHGETDWSLTGRHTGNTDLPLTARGELEASALAPLLANRQFDLVLVSPLKRAQRTCDLAGLARDMSIEPDLREWDYGAYEGLRSDEIHRDVPDWLVFRDGCPQGESPEQVGVRADRVIRRVRKNGGRVAVFAHGHILRVMAARWIGLTPTHGCNFLLDTATLSILSSYYDQPALNCWNASIH